MLILIQQTTSARGKLLKTLKIALPVALLTLCFSVKAFALAPGVTPEVNPAEGMSALALLGGAIMIFRGRLKR
jgi:hypothetical protein